MSSRNAVIHLTVLGTRVFKTKQKRSRFNRGPNFSLIFNINRD